MLGFRVALGFERVALRFEATEFFEDDVELEATLNADAVLVDSSTTGRDL